MEATLLAHCGTEKVERSFLSNLPIPEQTDTFQPIAHSLLVDAIEESLSFRHIHIERSEFAVSKDGMKMFGLLEVNQQYEGVNFAIGIRNANDKSMRLGMVAGYRVFVCDNMSLSGDFKPLLAKHTKNLDLTESVSMGIDRIQRGWQPLREAIDYKRATHIDPDAAKVLIYNAFAHKHLPISLFREVSQEFGTTPESTLWSLENNFTESFKTLNPIAQYKAAAKLSKLLTGGDT